MAGVAESVPSRFPIFPLRGAVLLPGGNLPLNIFEPRYLAMVRDAMRTDRVIGMIQPIEAEQEGRPTPLYRTGCLGRITSFAEARDNRLAITLSGFSRFDVAQELKVVTPYRQIMADFERWRGDLQPADPPASLQPRLIAAMRAYFEKRDIEADWDSVKSASLRALVVSLGMLCPFEPEEKQALIETTDLGRLGEMLVAMMTMDVLAGDKTSPSLLH